MTFVTASDIRGAVGRCQDRVGGCPDIDWLYGHASPPHRRRRRTLVVGDVWSRSQQTAPFSTISGELINALYTESDARGSGAGDRASGE
jgi:hypothetical protein